MGGVKAKLKQTVGRREKIMCLCGGAEAKRQKRSHCVCAQGLNNWGSGVEKGQIRKTTLDGKQCSWPSACWFGVVIEAYSLAGGAEAVPSIASGQSIGGEEGRRH